MTDPHNAIPSDHLASFEDDTDDTNIAHLIRRKEPRETSGPLAPSSAATIQGPQPVSDDDVSGDDPPAPTRTRRKTSSKPAPKPQPGGIRSTTVHLPYDIHQRLLRRRDDSGHSNGDLIKLALDATHDQLPEAIGVAAATGSSLFATAPVKAPRAVRAGSGPLVALNARFHESDLAVIDGLVDKHGASSRAHLITKALDLYLPDDMV